MKRIALWVWVACVAFAAQNQVLLAIEKDGLLVDVQQTVVDRRDGQPGVYRNIDRTMALKLKVTNRGFDDLEAGTVKYTVIIERWAIAETGTYYRYTGEAKLPALLRTKDVELVIGEYSIGGHLHGTSRKHVDDLVGWKLDFKLGEKVVTMASSTSFERMDKRAQDSR